MTTRILSFIVGLLTVLPNYSKAQTAPDFTITTSSGEVKSLYADYLNNNQTVVLKFFFTSCGPCRAISPSVETLYQEWDAGEAGVEFISLSIQNFDDNNDVAEFKTEYGLTFPGAGSDGGAQEAIEPYISGDFGDFFSTPTFTVIAPDGTVTHDVRGGTYQGTITALDEAIIATGQTKPGSMPPNMINYYSIGGKVTTANGTLINDAIVNYTTETTAGTLTNNPFTLDSIPENTSIDINVTSPESEVIDGITTFDLVLITKHILAIEVFETAQQFVAADADNSNTITTLDIITLRQLILDINTELPNNRTWAVLPIAYDDLTKDNIPSTSSYSFENIQASQAGADFTLIKVGDVNGSSSSLMGFQEKSTKTYQLFAEDVDFKIEDGELFVPIKGKDIQNILGMQFSLAFDTEYLSFKGVNFEGAAWVNPSNFGLNKVDKGLITFSWDNAAARQLDESENLFGFYFTINQSGSLKNVLSLEGDFLQAEAYSVANEIMNLDFSIKKTPKVAFDSSEITLYPNPVQDNFTISWHQFKNSTVNIYILDANGKKIDEIFSGLLNKGPQKIDYQLANLSSLLYRNDRSRRRENKK